MATILIVDDEPLHRQVIRSHLEAHGFAGVEAGSGEEALALARQRNPDLILLDIMMPNLDGLQVCRLLKEDKTTAAIPVVLLTAREGLEDRVRGLDTGANDYLAKPVDPSELLARVRAHLRVRQLYDEVEQRQWDSAQILELSKAVASTLRPSEIFHLIVDRIAELLNATRCSLVVIGEGGVGYVVASHDDPRITHLPISLDRYPEIGEVIQQRRPLIVDDAAQSPLMVGVRERLLALGFRSLLVMPISLRGTVVGTLVLRTARAGRPFTARELQLCQLIAEVAAIALQNAHLFESLELANLNLERLTLIDDLTQVYNRRFLFRKLEEETERAKRHGHPLSCVMLDVDDFKQVNDRFGHAQGDVVLKELALVIQEAIRRGDFFARYGGEEFVLLLPMTEGGAARRQAERIRQVVRSHPFPGISALLPLTVSQGVSSYPLDREITPADLLELADRALYRAKQAGKDTVVCAWEDGE
ncbi:MAG: diguanylate cyclase [candidate division NC10 bacterium]|nr:diguanylate cyclase [candidate division NC10 bacterium]